MDRGARSTDGPAATSAERPAAPAGDGPGAPSTDGPAATSAERPAAPTGIGPGARSADGPAAPSAERLAAPTGDGPGAPFPDGPAAPSADEPAGLLNTPNPLPGIPETAPRSSPIAFPRGEVGMMAVSGVFVSEKELTDSSESSHSVKTTDALFAHSQGRSDSTALLPPPPPALCISPPTKSWREKPI
ncbi:nematocyst expressed protein 3-like [Homalodisca vitripennis]|uniref:nematocyst expressed protein 3-like n=1 Tax=Homalodisca vitripennis TaxID=197043 RepID=UPI001EEBECA5|nr:nematocyst expressed protein 3-like [Homalodisca vitripennis]